MSVIASLCKDDDLFSLCANILENWCLYFEARYVLDVAAGRDARKISPLVFARNGCSFCA